MGAGEGGEQELGGGGEDEAEDGGGGEAGGVLGGDGVHGVSLSVVALCAPRVSSSIYTGACGHRLSQAGDFLSAGGFLDLRGCRGLAELPIAAPRARKTPVGACGRCRYR